jgi:hypothetical protein
VRRNIVNVGGRNQAQVSHGVHRLTTQVNLSSLSVPLRLAHTASGRSGCWRPIVQRCCIISTLELLIDTWEQIIHKTKNSYFGDLRIERCVDVEMQSKEADQVADAENAFLQAGK